MSQDTLKAVLSIGAFVVIGILAWRGALEGPGGLHVMDAIVGILAASSIHASASILREAWKRNDARLAARARQTTLPPAPPAPPSLPPAAAGDEGAITLDAPLPDEVADVAKKPDP